jgi:hypothetical protein
VKIVIQSGRNPFQLSILAACALYGIVALVAYDALASNSIKALGPASGRLFLALLGACALTALAGVIMHNLTGVFVERAGMIGLSLVCLAFAAVSAVTMGGPATGFVLLMVAISAASVGRLAQIQAGRRRAARAATSGDAP